jgi:hypothetical protein
VFSLLKPLADGRRYWQCDETRHRARLYSGDAKVLASATITKPTQLPVSPNQTLCPNSVRMSAAVRSGSLRVSDRHLAA